MKRIAFPVLNVPPPPVQSNPPWAAVFINCVGIAFAAETGPRFSSPGAGCEGPGSRYNGKTTFQAEEQGGISHGCASPRRRGRGCCMQAVKGLSMDKWLCWGSMAVAAILIIVFVLDLVLPANLELKPFGGLSPAIDVLCILASGLVFYLAFDAYRDIR